ncbi:UNVERIFIED_ORG: hypothetical protein EDC92_11932 [Dietzia maris]
MRAASAARASEASRPRGEIVSPRALFAAIISWSPRPNCRVDIDGTHEYREAPLPTTAPSDPWAIYLTDEDTNVRLLGFDFDDHHGDSAARVAADVTAFVSQLRTRSLAPLVCASGSGGGRHVWLRCAPVEHELVSRMADDLRALYPSLDISPLKNPTHGVLRAPGSTHRSGGRSTVIPGPRDTDVLHAVRAASVPVPEFLVHELADHFADLASTIPAPAPCPKPEPALALKTVSSRAAGASPEGSIPGAAWSTLPDWAQTLLDTQPDSDASERAFTLARSFIHAGWDRDRFLHAAFTEQRPGLEHLRTQPRGGVRVPRPRQRAHAIRQWNRAAVTISHPAFLAGRPSNAGAAAAIIHAAVALSESEMAGFTGAAGLVQRRVLHAFCAHLLHRGTVQAPLDVRNWALKAGLPRQVVSRAVRVLEEGGWIFRAKRHCGPLSAVWKLEDQRVTHQRDTKEPAPDESPSSRNKLTAGLSDIWSLPHLGPLALEVWWAIKNGTTTLPELTRLLGLDRRTIAARLRHAEAAGLVRCAGAGHWRAVRLELAEEQAGSHPAVGTLARRRLAYQAESLRWTQLWAEVVWRSRRSGMAPPPLEVQLLRHHAPSDAPPVEPDPLRRRGAELASTQPSCRNRRQARMDEMLTWARSWRHRLARGEQLTPMEGRIIATARRQADHDEAAAA